MGGKGLADQCEQGRDAAIRASGVSTARRSGRFPIDRLPIDCRCAESGPFQRITPKANVSLGMRGAEKAAATYPKIRLCGAAEDAAR